MQRVEARLSANNS